MNLIVTKQDLSKNIGSAQFSLNLVEMYNQLQKENKHFFAGGVRLWIHTNRATTELSLRPYVQEIWKLLFMSVDRVEQAALSAELVFPIKLNIEGYRYLPAAYDWIFIDLPSSKL